MIRYINNALKDMELFSGHINVCWKARNLRRCDGSENTEFSMTKRLIELFDFVSSPH